MSIGVRKGLGAATFVVVTVFAAAPTSSDAPRSARALRHAASPSAGVAGDLTVKFSQPPGTDGEAAPSGIDWVDRLPNGALAYRFPPHS